MNIGGAVTQSLACARSTLFTTSQRGRCQVLDCPAPVGMTASAGWLRLNQFLFVLLSLAWTSLLGSAFPFYRSAWLASGRD
jgi:hypothetical protein